METQRRLVNALLVLVAVMLIATCGYKFFGQNVNWLDAMYMTFLTLTTVGYGEVVDTSHSAVLRVFNLVVLGSGVGVMFYVISTATAFVVEGELKNVFWRKRMQKRISRLQGHVIVCGAGETGMHIVEELLKTGREVVVVDHDGQRLKKYESFSDVSLVEGDVTDEQVLEEAGLARASGLVAVLPSDKDNMVLTVIVRQKYPKLRIVARNIEAKMGEKILKAGADAAVCPSSIGGMRLASEMVRPHVVNFLDLMLMEQFKTLRIEEIPVPEHSKWVGLGLGQINLSEKFDLLCLAVVHCDDKAFQYNPRDSEVMKGNTVLVVMGNVENLNTAREAANTRSLS